MQERDNKIYYKKGYKYQLVEDFQIQICKFSDEDIVTHFVYLTKDGLLHIKKGYAWDGPSGPTLDTKSFMKGSLVHDALYQLIRIGKISPEKRNNADLELKRICLEDDMNKHYANIVYHSVKIFGQSNIDPKKEPKVRIAP